MEYKWSSVLNNSISRGQNGNLRPHRHAWESGSGSGCGAAALESGGNSMLCINPDPQLTCVKLGKRHYLGGRGRCRCRCQVEGCEALLANAKDYHRRHKVCQMHAKAPKVLLRGIHQRFCQQCSRFHSVGEFDDAKRSCRRRLAGHNQRRRKSTSSLIDHTITNPSSSSSSSIPNNQYQYHDIKMVGATAGRHAQPHLVSKSECALSLLSPWSASAAPDLPARCSAALRDLIAENRASALACRQVGPGPENRAHVTLNLMHGPDSAFGLLPRPRPSHEDAAAAGDCSHLWNLPLGY